MKIGDNHMDWFGVIETFLADGAVALLTAVIGFFFAKWYTSKLLFTKKWMILELKE